ncbi:MAG: TatD family hydrolase [Bacilli bacterium]|jgi:TatD DNase family protein|nr:TatD family hydrolase [Bacilli bacterium]
MRYLDTHCHLNDPKFASDLSDVISKVKAAGCLGCFNNADSLASFQPILQLAKDYPHFCYAVLGIHPEFAVKEDSYQEEAIAFVKAHLGDIKAIGEIGLDYHYSPTPEEKVRQQQIFRRWIELAKEVHLPIVVHSRDATLDTLEIIKEEKPFKVDLHCYSGSYDILKEYLKLPIDFHIGVGGVLTFTNSRVLKEVVTQGPLSCFLTETDSPYLAPVPHRGQRNDPSYIPLVIAEIAKEKNLSLEETCEILYHNGSQFYGIE